MAGGLLAWTALLADIFGLGLSGSSGQLKSPNYPGQYGHNANIEWIISAPEGRKIILSFMTFELETNHDYLEIRDGKNERSPVIHKLSGKHWADITSPGSHLHVKFTSDGSGAMTGFYISWEFERPSPIEIVRYYAPKLRFDSKFGTKEKCFPSSASDYYNSRASGNLGLICNVDYSTMNSGRVPTYWRAMECGEDLHIAYWLFTGYQDTCFASYGAHNSDWEHVVVKVENYKNNSQRLGAVLFYQHSGWYTRKRGHYETSGTRPVVYSGKNSHGSYHDAGGTGGCCYFKDNRNPGKKNQYMSTWLNLEELRRNTSKPAFMKDMSSRDKFEMTSPLERPETYEMCSLKGCKGSKLQICITSGCAKSQIHDHMFF